MCRSARDKRVENDRSTGAGPARSKQRPRTGGANVSGGRIRGSVAQIVDSTASFGHALLLYLYHGPLCCVVARGLSVILGVPLLPLCRARRRKALFSVRVGLDHGSPGSHQSSIHLGLSLINKQGRVRRRASPLFARPLRSTKWLPTDLRRL